MKMKKQQEFHKTVAVIRDKNLNPSCLHGPTILFERNGSRFFACSAYRSRKLCPFYLQEEKWKSTLEQQDKVDTEEKKKSNNKRKLVLETEEGHAFSDRNKKHVKSLEKINSINPENKEVQGKQLQIGEASTKGRLLMSKSLPTATQRDKGEAQYHFSEDTVLFFIEQFRKDGIDSILCIGTPSLHEYIQERSNSLKLKSFLLDIDERLINRYAGKDCAVYNMCNHFFFNGENEQYKTFLKRSKSLAIVTDPPFGVKVELIWNGCLKEAMNDFVESRRPGVDVEVPPCQIFWVFPYFMEGHIINKCSDSGLKMSDYKVEYKNHTKFSGKKQSKPSPARIFTTASLSTLNLPEEFYRYCGLCCKWVDKYNIHCGLCGVCPTKDGGKTYKHCKVCRKCVKPTWFHCQSCKKCHLETSSCADSALYADKASNQKVTSVQPKNPKGQRNIKSTLLGKKKIGKKPKKSTRKLK